MALVVAVVISGSLAVCILYKQMMSVGAPSDPEFWAWSWLVSVGPPGFHIHGGAESRPAELDAIAGGNKTSGNVKQAHAHNIGDKGTLVIGTYKTVDGKYEMPFAQWNPA